MVKCTETQISSRCCNLTAFILVGGTGTVYAANVGGIQRTIQLWIHGDQTDATLDVKEDGSYNLNYSDENGNTVEQGGGGVAFVPTEQNAHLQKMKSWNRLICLK